ncbi:MAG TPA: cobalt ABC transporter ATP-binding protein [Firmicutes bacterium]|nr:cobalt ABC transporter ATP-binding protein [Bacillota bacterium]
MKQPIIEVNNIVFKYPGADQSVLNDISCHIHKGDFLAVIGGNGSGKSTFCKSIVGLVPQFIVGDFSGTVRVDGENIDELPISDVAKKIGYVYQDFENQLVRPRVRDEVEFAPLNFGCLDYKEKAQKALEQVGIEHLADEFIWQLSGGQKHLLALASVLSLDPDVLILDEPIAQLDPLHGLEVYQLLKKLNEEYGKTIIVIEHHSKFIKNFCKQVLCLNEGQVVFHEPIAKCLENINELIKHSLLIKDKYDFSSQNLEEISDEVLVKVENVSHTYKSVDRSTHTSLNNVSLSFKAGEKVAILGGNGAGKTTLMKLMTGLTRLRSGDIIIDNKSIKSQSIQALAENITYLYQNPEDMFLKDCIQKDIEMFPRSRQREYIDELSYNIMTEFNLMQFKDRDGRLLSGGQQRRATLAIGMAMTPSIMLLDEPTASLDVNSRNELFKLLHLLKEQIKVVVIATHDLSLVTEWANRVIVMSKGQVVLDTTPQEFIESKIDMKQWGLLKEEVV